MDSDKLRVCLNLYQSFKCFGCSFDVMFNDWRAMMFEIAQEYTTAVKKEIVAFAKLPKNTGDEEVYKMAKAVVVNASPREIQELLKIGVFKI